MTNYTVFVQEAGKEGFVVIGHADTHTPKQAVELVLNKGGNGVSEGTVGATPTRSWYTQPFKFDVQPTLKLG